MARKSSGSNLSDLLKGFAPIIISLYALFQTCHNNDIADRNNEIAQNSREDSKRSAEIAQKSLELQQQQYNDFKVEEEQRNLDEKEKRVSDLNLINQHIAALNSQAKALNMSVKNTEISQKPYLNILNLGFHLDNINKDFSISDSAILSYKVINYGIQPAVLKEVVLYRFDKDCKFISKHPTMLNTLVTSTKTLEQTLLASEKRLKYGLQEIITLDDFFWCFTFKYRDDFKGTEVNTKNSPIIYKWINRRNTYNWVSQQVGMDVFIAFDLCSDQIEEDKIMKWFKESNH